MRTLILVHGRSQQNKDGQALKQEWLDALRAGFRSADLEFDVPDERVKFPYYGDTLDRLSTNPRAAAPQVVVAGPGDAGDPGNQFMGQDLAAASDSEKQFIGQVVAEVTRKADVTDEQIRAESNETIVEMGPLNWPWVLAALRVLDTVPGVGAAAIALTTRDVWMYLKQLGIQRVIDNGVRAAMAAGDETIVVGHSLGSVVSYNLLVREAQAHDWKVPQLITVGCPLGIQAVVELLHPISHPEGIGSWFNAYDPRDTVALNPLDHEHFGVTPAVENYGGVKNPTRNHHGISGYLGDPIIARRVHDALLE
jgi:hypothetical protein